MVHGSDVATAILAVHRSFDLAMGQRWLITDTRVYDWWDLVSAWGTNGEGHRGEAPEGPHPEWVRELMDEEGVRALPREMAKLVDIQIKSNKGTVGVTLNVIINTFL